MYAAGNIILTGTETNRAIARGATGMKLFSTFHRNRTNDPPSGNHEKGGKPAARPDDSAGHRSEMLRFIGPGLLLAIAAAGESGIAEAIEIGAHFGYAVIWVIALTLIFKFAFANGIARYTLVTGETIFEGIGRIPGPRHWANWLVMAIYLLEMFAFGGMLLLGAIFMDYLLPGAFSPEIIAVITITAIILLLWKESYERLETIILAIALLLFAGIGFSLLKFPLSLTAVSTGIVPQIPDGSLLAIMALMGAVGSGLNILLYSIWLREKTGGEHGTDCFRRWMPGVNLDLALAFLFIGVVTVLFISLGMTGFAVSYIEHGEAFPLDSLIAQVLYVIAYIPYGVPVFLTFGYLIMFGAVLTGMDGRARAISSFLRNEMGMQYEERDLFRLLLMVFSLMILMAVVAGEPMAVVHGVSAIAAIAFSVMGFVLMYLDMQLPEEGRGSRLWLFIIGTGSIVFLLMALFMEEAVLSFGLPLAERLIVVAFVLFVFARTRLFRSLLDGTAGLGDRLWTVLIFGVLSVYGTFRGIHYADFIINFRDLAPVLAGMIGGPLVGAGAGIIGALYRYPLGGSTALACSVATVAAGIIAGLYTRMYRGDISVLRGCILMTIVEAAHIFIFIPLLSGITVFTDFLDIVRVTFLPMLAAQSLVVVIFLFILADEGLSLKARFTATGNRPGDGGIPPESSGTGTDKPEGLRGEDAWQETAPVSEGEDA